MVRKWSVANLIILLAAVIVFVAPQAAGALTILTPQDGATVREKVKIAIPRSSVPNGGFVSIIIDGQYFASVSTPTDPNANVVYWWDTKAKFIDPRGEEKDQFTQDGKHQIQVTVHNPDALVIESATITVKLANKVPVANPNAPMRFAYRFRTGDYTRYNVYVRGDLIDSTGQNLLGGRPAFSSTYEMGQWIEDARPDGSALVRYKVTEPPLVTLMGQTVVTAELGEAALALPPSVYKNVDRYGRTLDDSVFHKGAGFTASDIMVPLPIGLAKIGEKWQGTRGIKAEGLGNLIRLNADYSLESLEYEGGRPCAKIDGSLVGSNVRINFLPGQFQTEPKSAVKGDTEVYFDFNAGKVISSRLTMEVNATVDSSAIGSLASTESGETTLNAPIFSQYEEGEEEMQRQPSYPGMLMPGAAYNPYGVGSPSPYMGQPGGAGQAASRASVKLRITATTTVATGQKK